MLQNRYHHKCSFHNEKYKIEFTSDISFLFNLEHENSIFSSKNQNEIDQHLFTFIVIITVVNGRTLYIGDHELRNT